MTPEEQESYTHDPIAARLLYAIAALCFVVSGVAAAVAILGSGGGEAWKVAGAGLIAGILFLGSSAVLHDLRAILRVLIDIRETRREGKSA